VFLSSALIFFGWASSLPSFLAEARQPLAASETSEASSKGEQLSLFASLKDFYLDLKDIFSSSRSGFEIQKQPEEPVLPEIQGPLKEQQPKENLFKPGGLPLE
jgi:hypothetical protein